MLATLGVVGSLWGFAAGVTGVAGYFGLQITNEQSLKSQDVYCLLSKQSGGTASRVASAAACGPDICSISPQLSWPSPYDYKRVATTLGITLTHNTEDLSFLTSLL